MQNKMENGTQTNNISVIEMKDSVKVAKNSRGYNWEIRIVAKEGIDLFRQLDYTKAELDKRLEKWKAKDAEK